MPSGMARVCLIQFLAWFAWFTFFPIASDYMGSAGMWLSFCTYPPFYHP